MVFTNLEVSRFGFLRRVYANELARQRRNHPYNSGDQVD